jgi:hypothetical protein
MSRLEGIMLLWVMALDDTIKQYNDATAIADLVTLKSYSVVTMIKNTKSEY